MEAVLNGLVMKVGRRGASLKVCLPAMLSQNGSRRVTQAIAHVTLLTPMFFNSSLFSSGFVKENKRNREHLNLRSEPAQ